MFCYCFTPGVLQCCCSGVAVCCSVLQCVAVLLQCVAGCDIIHIYCPGDWCVAAVVHRVSRSVLQCATMCCSVLQCVAVCCIVWQCFAVCCSVLQCVAECCNLLQRCCSVLYHIHLHMDMLLLSYAKYLAVCCSIVAVCCIVLQCVALCCTMSQYFIQYLCTHVMDVLLLSYTKCVAVC